MHRHNLARAGAVGDKATQLQSDLSQFPNRLDLKKILALHRSRPRARADRTWETTQRRMQFQALPSIRARCSLRSRPGEAAPMMVRDQTGTAMNSNSTTDCARRASVYVVTFRSVRLFQADRLCRNGRLYGTPGANHIRGACGHHRTWWRLADLVRIQTRLVALGCAIYVLIAALIAHRNFGDGNQSSHFMKNMAIVGGFLAIMAMPG